MAQDSPRSSPRLGGSDEDGRGSEGRTAESGDEHAPISPTLANLEIPTPEASGTASGWTRHRRPSSPQSAGSFSSRSSRARRPYSPYPRGESHSRPRWDDPYLYNPALPEWNEDDWSYYPWQPEKDGEVAAVLESITEPPHKGMLESVDPHHRCRNLIESSPECWRIWAELMGYFDSAAGGKKRAFDALVAAHRKIRYEEDSRKYSERNSAALEEKVETLEREQERAQLEQERQQERILKLESENTQLRNTSRSLKTEYEKQVEWQENQLISFEEVLTKWESLLGETGTQSSYDDDDDDEDNRLAKHERKFRLIKKMLEEKTADVARTKARCEALEEECDEIRHKLYEATETAEMARGDQQPLLEQKANYEAMALDWERQVRELKKQLEMETRHAKMKEQKHQDQIQQLTARHNQLSESSQAEIRRLKDELDIYKARSESLEQKVDQLEQMLADQEVKAAYDHSEAKSKIEAVSKSVSDLDSMIADVVSATEHSPDSPSPSLSTGTQESLSSEQVREMEASQHEHVETSGAMMDEIRAGLGKLDDQLREHLWMSSTPATTPRSGSHVQFPPAAAGPTLQEELEGLTDTLDSLQKEHEAIVQGDSEMASHLSSLQAKLAAAEKALQEIGQRANHQRSQVQAIQTTFESGSSEVAPSLESPLERHGERLSELGEDRKALQSIWDKLRAMEEQQQAQNKLLEEYRVYRIEHPPRPLGAGQSEELWRLANNFIESSSQSRRSSRGEMRQAAVDALLARVQELTADRDLAELRLQLEDGIAEQDVQRAQVEAEIARFDDLIIGIQKQIEALDRLKEKEPVKKPADIEFDDKYRAGLAQRAERLRRENRYNHGRVARLAEHRDRIDNFLKNDADLDRRHAEKLLTQTLLKIQVASRPGRHGEAICFCTLLRFFFPQIYYSTLQGGCCAGGKFTAPSTALLSAGPVASAASPPTSPASATTRRTPTITTTTANAPICQGHHGHGLLASSSRLYTLLCHGLTSLTWLVLLLLVQPYNLYTTAAFVFAFLTGLPPHLYRLARRAYRRRHRLLLDLRNLWTLLPSLRNFLPGLPGLPADVDPSATAAAAAAAASQRRSHHKDIEHDPGSVVDNNNNDDNDGPLFTLPPLSSLLPAISSLLPPLPPLPLPQPSAIVGSLLTLSLLYAFLSYVAVSVERRVWTGGNDWRLAYLHDLQSFTTTSPSSSPSSYSSMGMGKGRPTGIGVGMGTVPPYPYPVWSPLRVDYRLLVEPGWVMLEEAAHSLFFGKGLGLTGAVVGAIGGVVRWPGEALWSVGKGFAAGWGWVSGLVQGVGQFVVSLAGAAVGGTGEAVRQVVGAVGGWVGGLGREMASGVGAIGGWVGGLVREMASGVGAFGGWVGGLGGVFWEGIKAAGAWVSGLAVGLQIGLLNMI